MWAHEMSLRRIIQGFLNHVQAFDARFLDGEDLYDKEFVSLKTLTDDLKKNAEFSSSHGESEVNRPKNRYKDILPYNYTRVSLCEIDGVPGSDYINASYIKGASGTQAYIASQGPLQQTLEDFWRMAWECKIQVIVMASNEVECGKHKCERYWAAENEEKQIGNFTIKLVNERDVCSDFLVRTLHVKCLEEERTIVQFHYRSWPDHGIPTSVTPILELVRLVRDCQSSEALPVLIHCSAGCGRTGTICAIDYVWGLLRAGKLNENFNLLQLVLNMRKQRTAMVQTKEQYILVYKAIQELFERHLRVIDSHPYENVDFSGQPVEVDDENDYISIAAVDEMLSAVEKEETQQDAAKSDSSQTPPLPEKKKKKNDDVVISSTETVSNTPEMEKVAEDEHEKPRSEKAVNRDDEDESVCDDQPVMLRSGPNLAVGSDSFLATSSRTPSPNDKRTRKSSPDLSLSESRSSKVSRRPSIARLRAFFEKRASQTGSSYDSDDVLQDSVRLRKSSEPTSSSVSPDLDQSKETTANKRHGQVMDLLDEKEYSEIVSRYQDAALLVYNEIQTKKRQERHLQRQLNPQDNRKSTSGSEKLDETLPSCSSDDQVASDVGSVRSIYDNTNGDTSPGNNSCASTPGPVRSHRDSESPGKQSMSTWYDKEMDDSSSSSPVARKDEDLVETDPNRLQVNDNKPGMFGSLFKNGGKSTASITRSISMKVGIQSPFARRRAAKEKCNVADYLAVEEGEGTDEKNKVETRANQALRTLKNNFSFKKTNVADPVVTSTPTGDSVNFCGKGEGFRTYVNFEEPFYPGLKTQQSSSPRLLRYTKSSEEETPNSSVSNAQRPLEDDDKDFNSLDEDLNLKRSSVSFAEEVRGSIENLFGADMDEYCQQIIRSCQDYLVAAEYTNITPKSIKNIEWIENTLRDSPRRAIVDVTSTSSQIEIFDNDYSNLHVGNNKKQEDVVVVKKKNNHDYEKLWFAESPNFNDASSRKPAAKNKNDDFKLTLNVKFDANDIKQKESHYRREQDKDTHLNKTVQELQSLIEELEMNIPTCQSASNVTRSKPKKPQPAPRTILNTERNLDLQSDLEQRETSSPMLCGNARRAERDLDCKVPLRQQTKTESDLKNCKDLKPSEVHIYERIYPLEASLNRNQVSRMGVVNFDDDEDDDDMTGIYGQIRRVKVEDAEGSGGSGIKPKAPPRLKRQSSSSSKRSVPTATSSGYVTTINTGQGCTLPEVDDDIPPVPVKTKDAYLLPSENDGNGLDGKERLKGEGGSIGKAFGKMHVVNLLSKFGLKSDQKEFESPSSSPDNQSPLLARRVLPATTSELGYPHRFPKRPLGPRECPAN